MASLIQTARTIRDRLAGLSRAPVPYAYLGDQTAIVTTRAGKLLLVDTRDYALTPHLITHGNWEPDVERALIRLLRPGMRIVEVGANMGYHTLTMATAVGKTGHVDAFEPNPRLFALLSDSMALNGYNDIVSLHRSAALDRSGPVKFQYQARYIGGGNVVVPGYEDPANQHLEVPGVRLDDVLGGGPPVHLLRMDAEGCEPLALRGGEQLLRRSPQMRIMMEFSANMMRARVDVSAFAAWLATFGFKSWRLEPSGALTAVPVADLPNAPHCEIVLSRDVPAGAH